MCDAAQWRSGLMVARETGVPLGIITSNARHSSGKVIPSINFAIPLAALAPVAAYLASNGTGGLGEEGEPAERACECGGR